MSLNLKEFFIKILKDKEEIFIGNYKMIYLRGTKTVFISKKYPLLVINNSSFLKLGIPAKKLSLIKKYTCNEILVIEFPNWVFEISDTYLKINNKIYAPKDVLMIASLYELEKITNGLLIPKAKKILEYKEQHKIQFNLNKELLEETIKKEVDPSKKSLLYAKLKLLNIKKDRLMANLDIKLKAENKKREFFKKMQPIRTIIYEGIKISFARNQKQNSKLYRSLKKNSQFIFLHVNYFPGSTVIIHNEAPSEAVLRVAGVIAGLYSKAWDAGLQNIQVGYTTLDNVTETEVAASYLVKNYKSIEVKLNLFLQLSQPYITLTKSDDSIINISSGGIKKESYLNQLKKILPENILELLPTRFCLNYCLN